MKVGTIGWTDVPLLTDTKPPARHTPSAQSQQNATKPHLHRGRGPDSTSRMSSDNNCDYADRSLCGEPRDPLRLHFQDWLGAGMGVCVQTKSTVNYSPNPAAFHFATCFIHHLDGDMPHPPARPSSLSRVRELDWTKIIQRRRWCEVDTHTPHTKTHTRAWTLRVQSDTNAHTFRLALTTLVSSEISMKYLLNIYEVWHDITVKGKRKRHQSHHNNRWSSTFATTRFGL